MRRWEGRREEEKETLADKPLHFENSCSPTNGVSDWRDSDFLIDTICATLFIAVPLTSLYSIHNRQEQGVNYTTKQKIL